MPANPHPCVSPSPPLPLPLPLPLYQLPPEQLQEYTKRKHLKGIDLDLLTTVLNNFVSDQGHNWGQEELLMFPVVVRTRISTNQPVHFGWRRVSSGCS